MLARHSLYTMIAELLPGGHRRQAFANGIRRRLGAFFSPSTGYRAEVVRVVDRPDGMLRRVTYFWVGLNRRGKKMVARQMSEPPLWTDYDGWYAPDQAPTVSIAVHDRLVRREDARKKKANA